MEKFFVNRPIFAIVIAIVILLLGGLSIGSLPIEQYPNITPPVVEVEASYMGADAVTVNNSVATPLAEGVMGVGDMLYMQTTSAGDGSMSLQILFDINSDPNLDEIFVQNKISSSTAGLPSEVIEQGVTTQKSQTGFLLIYALYSQGGVYDENFLANWAYINIQNELLKIDGVGKVQILGAGKYAMRVWVNPYRMALYDISVEDIATAIQNEATIFSAGKMGAEPLATPEAFTYTVTTPPALSEAEQYEAIALRVLPDGEKVTLGDVARVELGCQTYGALSNFDSDPAALVVVYQTPGSNAVEVGSKVKATMATIEERFPESVATATIIDATESIEEGIEEIFGTMLFTLLLVILVIFVFLQDWRATLIPLIAIPVSIIGAFAVFPLLGFSINIISLLGLVLAIGLVVDDAIVVVEAVQVGIEQGKSARKATLEAMRQVASPIVATTVVLLAVFIPATLMEGITGKIFQQFSMGISVALVISAFNALTLSPALCSLLLRHKERTTRGALGLFNRLFDRGVDGYMHTTQVVVRHSVRTLLLVLLTGGVTLLLFKALPSGFLTTEDQGYLMVSVELPDAASVARTEEAIDKAVKLIRSTEGVRYEASTAGFDLLTGVEATNSGVIFVTLDPYNKRKLSAEEIADELNARLYVAVPDATFYAFEPPSIPGLGVASGVTFVLQDRGNGDIAYLDSQTRKFMAAADSLPQIATLSTQFDAEVPQRKLSINEALALQEGVSPADVRSLLSAMYGGMYVGNFNRFGKLYKTYIQADAEYRRTESDLAGYYVKNSKGESVPIAPFVELKDTVGVEYISQFNLYNAIAVNATPAKGVSSDDAMKALETLAEERLPSDVSLAWSGVSYQEANASGGGATYLLAVIFVFLALAALYNSWSLPVSVLLGVPLALFGAMLFVSFAHLFNPIFIDNIFMKVSLVMLIGLSAKSAILVVEYADRKFYDEGKTLGEASLAAAKLRLRPILMTAIAFVVGILPLVFASGAYSVARNVMGVALVGGMIIATALGIFVYPSLYYLVGRVAQFEKRRERMIQKRKEYEKENTI